MSNTEYLEDYYRNLNHFKDITNTYEHIYDKALTTQKINKY